MAEVMQSNKHLKYPKTKNKKIQFQELAKVPNLFKQASYYQLKAMAKYFFKV